MKKKTAEGRSRPILWVGGSGLPGGAVGKKLVSLGYPLHWEPASAKAARSVSALAPALVVIDEEKLDGPLRNLLGALAELKPTVDLVVFQLRSREARVIPERLDGVLLRGPALVQQIGLVLSAIEGGRPFKAAGTRAVKKLESASAEVERLRTLAVRDDLTSLYNLRFFNRSLETEHQRATRFGRSYSLIFLDLDGLREVNTREGHMAGAQVLKHVGEFLMQRIRRIDLPARIGGDEFVVICPETEKVAVRQVADRLRHGIQRLQNEQGKPLGITASIGVASFPQDGELPEEILQRADRALYEAKALGKNRVCCWGEFETGTDDKTFDGSVHGGAGRAENEEEREPVSEETAASKKT
ncbi:MAG TPA: GGDEF domain-containing protein [Vicinamibacteria bacterium]|nr:GGDEF domain-containing protein [Vicinamibacteria bacterium]